ncbi:MAG: NADP-reducing hydrogenase subunit HndA [Deltaproteobacteria bacterium ADurb.Bin151]|nr:MAG: NADP-reducing hydrogenase subunit HndA [Deltaproteobacteria bacterium ADurb.Bin151]
MKHNAHANDEMKKTGSAEAETRQGICSSCENLSLCSFTQPLRQPVFYCEEFTSGLVRTAPVVVEKKSGAPAVIVLRDGRRGLCTTCDDTESCLYPKDEAGIWHCEEYRCESSAQDDQGRLTLERRSVDTTNILKTIKKHDKNKGALIAILEEIQAVYTYLPEEALRLVSKETGRSMTDIYGVATFYKAFSLKPRGRHCVSVCLGTACHVRGAQGIVDEFKRELDIAPGETTPDNEITLETVNCLGACALGPTVVADGHYFPHVSKSKVKSIIAKAMAGLEKIDVETDNRFFPLPASCPVCKQSLLDPDYPLDGYPSVHLHVSSNGTKGGLRLSSLYGSGASVLEHPLPADSLSRFYCPHCTSELPSFSNCSECGSPMATLQVREACAWEVCTRQGCEGHLLNLNQTNMQK